MFIHRIKTFQKLLQSGKYLYIDFETVSAENLLRFLFHKCKIDFWIAAVADDNISADCKCVNGSTFFIKGHVHFVGHGKLSGMLADFFINRSIQWSGTKDHDQADQ